MVYFYFISGFVNRRGWKNYCKFFFSNIVFFDCKTCSGSDAYCRNCRFYIYFVIKEDFNFRINTDVLCYIVLYKFCTWIVFFWNCIGFYGCIFIIRVMYECVCKCVCKLIVVYVRKICVYRNDISLVILQVCVKLYFCTCKVIIP